MLYRKIEKVIEDHLKSGSAKILLIEDRWCLRHNFLFRCAIVLNVSAEMMIFRGDFLF